MCGIAGSLVRDGSAIVSVMRALDKLQNRGYDSAGIATTINNKVIIQKSISKPGENAIQNLRSDPIANLVCNIAIAHTRWATHGAQTLENAHPHYDDSQRYCLIHNGIIENYMELKGELQTNEYQFYGQTDSEVVVKYLDFLSKKNNNIEDLSKRLRGSWAILILDSYDPTKIWFLKNGSPLILGFNKRKTKAMFASEVTGLDEEIEYYYIISDHDYGYVLMDDMSCELYSTKTYEPIPIVNTMMETSPFPYNHWTIKEINEQPNAISSLLSNRMYYNNDNFILNFPELEKLKQELDHVEHFILLACGTSYHAAQLGAKFFKEFRTNVTLEVIDGADFEKIDIPPNTKTVLVLLSQSGETKDLYRALQIGKGVGLKSIGIINVENSLIAREVDCVLYLNAGREHAVASTKSFTNQVIMLLLFALWKTPQMDPDLKKQYFMALHELSKEFYQIIKKSITEIPKMVCFFKNQNNCFILGKHASEWIAKEASLKIKEISYIHSEGFSAAALKHGPFALLSKDVPVILLANNDNFYSKIENVAAEVKSRFANIIYITNKAIYNEHIDFLFYFNTDSILFPLMAIVPLQILAYELALDRGNHPDYPRNLAKVVTVE